jgi:ubiquinone/menaquinone biosynthesis C-methylase UbiE
MKKSSLKNFLIGNYQKLTSFKNPKDYVALDPEHSNNALEFEQYGNRLAAFVCRRLTHHSTEHLEYLSFLEIGCGMGRLLKPFSSNFNLVTGVDISSEILDAARVHLKGIQNFDLIENNGVDLSAIPDNHYNIVFSGGVFQHIPDREVLANYIHEGLRVVELNGLYLFTFQVWQTNTTGKDRVGAKITANWLNSILKNTNAEILEISSDDKDPIPHYSVILRKSETNFRNDFNSFPVSNIPWRSICWRNLITKKNDHNLIGKAQRAITFYDPE